VTPYSFGPLVHGFLNEPIQADVTSDLIVVNSAWSYDSKERVDDVESDLNFLLSFISLKGLYPGDLESFKVEKSEYGFTSNAIFTSY